MVVGRVPIEFAHQVKQPLLPPARDKFLQSFGDGRLLGALAADFKRSFNKLWIDRQVGGHVRNYVWNSTHTLTQSLTLRKQAAAVAGNQRGPTGRQGAA